MASLPSQKLAQYYENYATKEIAFNKSVINVLGLETKKVYLKIRGDHWPCIIYSCSMKNSKVIVNLDSTAFEEIKKAKNFVSLRMSFIQKDSKNPIVFFVPSVIKGYNNFNINNSQGTFIVSIEFTQKPPDDLIEILGKLIESAENFEKRKALRINLDGKVIEDMGFVTNKVYVTIENIKRPCIIKNISASGCLIILACVPKFLINKKAYIQLLLKSEKNPIILEGNIVRYEEVQGRKDIYGLGIQFIEQSIPFEFKEIINSYIDKLENISKNKR